MTFDPRTVSVSDMLTLVDKAFGIDRVMKDWGRDVVPEYYAQSGPAYERMHSTQGCMHYALNSDGVFSYEGYLVQPRAVLAEVAALKGSRVLELGCGKGFNSLFCAQHMHDVQFTGTDLLPAHVEKARVFAADAGRDNVVYEQASYEPLPDRFRGYDVAFGFETLCYSKDTDLVAASIAAALRPGGRFVMFDMQAMGDVDALPSDLARATRLYGISLAMTNGFLPAGQWEKSLEKAGLVVDPVEDVTKNLLPGLYHQVEMSHRTLSDWKKRFAIKALPPYMTRNAIAALFGPAVCRLGRDTEDGILVYQKITATKPR